MDSYEQGPWEGASGQAYTYYVFGLKPEIPSRSGNYIYARKNEANIWVPVYMGHGDLAVCCADRQRLDCIIKNGATSIHLRLNPLEEDRIQELNDLLAQYRNTFYPNGCNIKSHEN